MRLAAAAAQMRLAWLLKYTLNLVAAFYGPAHLHRAEAMEERH